MIFEQNWEIFNKKLIEFERKYIITPEGYYKNNIYTFQSYIGEMKNNKAEGKGILDLYPNLICFGNWKNDRAEGYSCKFIMGIIIEGEHKNGKPNGNCTISLGNGDTFEG